MDEIYVLTVLVAPMFVAVILTLFRRRLTNIAGKLAGVAALLSLLSTVALLPVLQQGRDPAMAFTWVPTANIELRLHIDWVTFPFLITETVVTLVAVVYAWGYHHRDERTPYFYALLLVFAVGMSGTTLADDLVLFYVFWELMLVASAALIMVWGEERPDGPQRQSVVLKYFIFTHLGSLLVLAGLLILYNLAGRDSFSALRQGVEIPSAMVSTLTLLFLIGFGTKMALFPLHVWLPDAHTIAPMPVTIMLAAAMLSMGTYGILRFPMSLFTRDQLAGFSLPMMIMGAVSVIYGGLMALAERDIKRIIAYSSVSQMGYVLFGLGTFTHDGIIGGTVHVIYHAIIKALLFIVTGQVIYATGRRYLKDLGGLLNALPAVAASAVIGVLAIAGTPPLPEFDSEWMIFSGGFQTDYIAVTVITLLGSVLTVAYAFWFGGRIFFGSHPPDLEVKPLPLSMVVPGVVLAILAILAGIFPASVFAWAEYEFSLLLGGLQ